MEKENLGLVYEDLADDLSSELVVLEPLELRPLEKPPELAEENGSLGDFVASWYSG